MSTAEPHLAMPAPATAASAAVPAGRPRDELWIRCARAPVTVAFTTVLIITAGVLGSIFGQNVVDLQVWPRQDRVLGAELFVGIAVLAAGLFFLERCAARVLAARAQVRLDAAVDGLESRIGTLSGEIIRLEAQRQEADTERTKAEERLIEATEVLTELVRTMPPSDTLHAFESCYSQVNRLTEDTLAAASADPDPANREILDGSICKVLDAILVLARKFSHGTPSDEASMHGINVMLFHPANNHAPGWQQLARRCSQREPGSSTSADVLLGVLEYRPELAIGTPGPQRRTGDEPFELVLPIPSPTFQQGQTGKSRVLPGAPIAWLEKTAKLYLSVDAYLNDLSTRCALSPEVEAQARRHFSETAPNVKSFLSLPLGPSMGKPPAAAERSTHPLGVLNIHRATPGIFGEEKIARQFATLALPLISMVDRLLDARHALEGARN